MAPSPPGPAPPARGRLSRKIVFWVFLSVVVIEGIILVPSYDRRKAELLLALDRDAETRLALFADSCSADSPKEALSEEFRRFFNHPTIVGAALFDAEGNLLGGFGEPTRLSAKGPTRWIDDAALRYEVRIGPDAAPARFTAAVRRDTKGVRHELHAFILRIAGLVMIISVVVTAGAWFALSPIVVTPILRLRNDLKAAGEAISRDGPAPLFTSARKRRPDELGEVIDAFRWMFHQASDAIRVRKATELALKENYAQLESYSALLNEELEKGRKIQLNFLPPRLIPIRGWDAAAHFRPARRVAGDFYDLFELPGGRIGLVVSDVCDKGVGAALFMALIRSLIRIFSGQTRLEAFDCRTLAADPVPWDLEGGQTPPTLNPERILEAVAMTNRYIATNHGELAMFATLFFGVLNPEDGRLHYTNGGHDPLYVLDARGGIRAKLPPTGPAVGLIPEARFDIKEAVLAPGETLLGYTDGVTEAMSPEGRLFGTEQLEALLLAPSTEASDLLTRLARALRVHMGQAEPVDDITLLALRRESS